MKNASEFIKSIQDFNVILFKSITIFWIWAFLIKVNFSCVSDNIHQLKLYFRYELGTLSIHTFL